MKNTLETKLGIFFALALITAAVLVEWVGGTDLFRRGLELQARFRNVQELKPGDPVKMAGKEVGRVRDIQFDEDRLVVRLKITDRNARIRTDSVATIKFSGLLGQNYVAVDFGSSRGELLKDGGLLQTVDPQDVNELISKLDGVAADIKKITANLSDVKIDEIIMPLTDLVREGKPLILNILTNADATVAQIASGQGTIGRLVRSEELYASALSTVTNLNSTAEDARAVVADGKAIIAGVRAGQGTLGRLTTDAKLYEEATEAVVNLKEIMQKINRGQGTVGGLVNDDAFLKNATLTLQKVDKATETLEDQGPLSVLGILVSPLF